MQRCDDGNPLLMLCLLYGGGDYKTTGSITCSAHALVPHPVFGNPNRYAEGSARLAGCLAVRNDDMQCASSCPENSDADHCADT